MLKPIPSHEYFTKEEKSNKMKLQKGNTMKTLLISTSKVKKITKLETGRVIDISVKNNNTFITKSGIVVHNCNSTQPALRGFIESFSKNARFILTCNYPQKIIEPLRNRLINIDFDDMTNKHKSELIKGTFLRAKSILENEKIEYNQDDLKWIVKHFYPSSRAILNKIQEFTTNKILKINKDEIDSESLNNQILTDIMNKDFENLRKNCARLPDPSSLFLTLYDSIDDFPQKLRPGIIITIAKYQSYDSQVRDRLINTVALSTEIIEML